MIGSARRRIRIIVVDDNPLVVAGMRVGLRRFDRFDFIGEAGDPETGLALIESQRPDVALIDLMLPRIDGLTLAARVRRADPKVRNIIISGALARSQVDGPFPEGVDGYFHKSGPVSWLARIIYRAWRRQGLPRAAEQREPKGGLASLTLREHEVLAHLGSGCSLKEIATHMQTTYKTVDHLNESLMKKLDLHSRIELVRLALRECLGGERAHSPPFHPTGPGDREAPAELA